MSQYSACCPSKTIVFEDGCKMAVNIKVLWIAKAYGTKDMPHLPIMCGRAQMNLARFEHLFE